MNCMYHIYKWIYKSRVVFLAYYVTLRSTIFITSYKIYLFYEENIGRYFHRITRRKILFESRGHFHLEDIRPLTSI